MNLKIFKKGGDTSRSSIDFKNQPLQNNNNNKGKIKNNH